MQIDPCPTCNHTELEVRQGWCTYYVYCTHCNTSGPEDTNKVRTIREWNKIRERVTHE